MIYLINKITSKFVSFFNLLFLLKLLQDKRWYSRIGLQKE